MKLKLYHVEEIELDEKATYDFLLAKANGKAMEFLRHYDDCGTLELTEWREMI